MTGASGERERNRTGDVVLGQLHGEASGAVGSVDRVAMLNDLEPLEAGRERGAVAHHLSVDALDARHERSRRRVIVGGNPFGDRLTADPHDGVHTHPTVDRALTEAVPEPHRPGRRFR